MISNKNLINGVEENISNEINNTNNTSTNTNYYDDYFTPTENGLDGEFNNLNVGCITSKNNKFSIDSEGNIICNSISTNVQSNNLNFNQIYPIGSIYMSVTDVNPGVLFDGTTWEKIVDKFLIGAGSNYSLGSTGGNESHVHTTPTHSHGLNNHVHGANNTANGTMYACMAVAGTYGLRYKTKTGVSFAPNERKADGGAGYTYTTNQTEGVQINGTTSKASGNTTSVSAGNTGSSSNIPPYLAINIWKRIS